eukprot:3976479-Prymnesium_polylepis.1
MCSPCGSGATHDSSRQDLAAAVTEHQTTDIPASTNPYTTARSSVPSPPSTKPVTPRPRGVPRRRRQRPPTATTAKPSLQSLTQPPRRAARCRVRGPEHSR